MDEQRALEASHGGVASHIEGADTLPSAPGRALDDDADHRALVAFAGEARAFLAERAWDNLAHVERFARAAALARPLLARAPHAGERRALLALLWPLLPEASRARAFVPLASAVAARAPAFLLERGDLPRIAPAYSAFLARADLVQQLVGPGTGPFLVGRGLCPAAARGSCSAILVDELFTPRQGDLFARDSVPPAGVHARGRVPLALFGGEGFLDVRTGPDGRPLRTVEGHVQPIVVPVESILAWIFSAGPDARGLDLRSDDDRALLLAFAHALRVTHAHGRSAFAWLEDESAPRHVRVDVVGACVQAAIDVVLRHTLDPYACRIALRAHADDGGWPQQAAAALDDVGLFRDVLPRARAPDGDFARDIAWADAVAPSGFAAGRLSAVGAGRAFARLATSVLAPLGVLTMSGLKDGSGAVVLHRLVPVTDDAVRAEPPRLVTFGDAFGLGGGPGARALADAWRDGDGHALPEPGGRSARHDVAGMPAWLALFLEGIA